MKASFKYIKGLEPADCMTSSTFAVPKKSASVVCSPFHLCAIDRRVWLTDNQGRSSSDVFVARKMYNTVRCREEGQGVSEYAVLLVLLVLIVVTAVHAIGSNAHQVIDKVNAALHIG